MPIQQPPNILWFCSDGQRFDTIRALGSSAARTPTLDRLVERGVSFTQAYCQSPLCTSSRASFLTGRYPATTHVYRNGHPLFPSTEVLVTKQLSEEGYDCGLVGKLHLSTAQRGERRYDDGYRVFHQSSLPVPDDADNQNQYLDWLRNEKGVDPHELYEGCPSFCGAGVTAELSQVRWCSEMAIHFVTEPRDSPWLLSVNPFAPHPPFTPPVEFLDHFNPADMPAPWFRDSDLERQRDFANIRQQKLEAVDPFGPMPDATAFGISSETADQSITVVP